MRAGSNLGITLSLILSCFVVINIYHLLFTFRDHDFFIFKMFLNNILLDQLGIDIFDRLETNIVLFGEIKNMFNSKNML